jgi:enoyl-CoA hydratase
MAMADSVTVETQGNVLIAHLDDGKANALSMATIASLMAIVDQAEADEAIDALVLHGRAGRFSGGFDLDVIRGGDPAAISALVCAGGDLVQRLYGAGVPVVAACTGHALAAGALVLLGCDVRIGADIDCKIGLNEVAIGMVLPKWAMTISKERLNPTHVQRAVANGRLTDGRGAVEAGYLDEVVPADDVLAAAVAAASSMSTLHRRAYIGTVLSFRGATLKTLAEQIASDRNAGLVPTV